MSGPKKSGPRLAEGIASDDCCRSLNHWRGARLWSCPGNDTRVALRSLNCDLSRAILVRENYLPPPWRPNFGRSCEGYGRYDFPVFSRIWVSTVDLGTQSSILLSGGGGR